jgi:hypothetical protein
VTVRAGTGRRPSLNSRSGGWLASASETLLVSAISLLLAACSPGASATAVPSGLSGSLPPPATGTPGASAGSGAASPSSSPASSPVSSGTVRIDPALLSVLPTTVDGAAIAEAPEAEAESATDRTLSGSVDRLASAFVASADGTNWAYASIIALKMGAFNEPFYRDWRDTFDRGACSQAGGVTGSAQSSIGGRLVFIGRCAGGLLTYHAYLPGTNLLVSISALGPQRYGERVVQGLRSN